MLRLVVGGKDPILVRDWVILVKQLEIQGTGLLKGLDGTFKEH